MKTANHNTGQNGIHKICLGNLGQGAKQSFHSDCGKSEMKEVMLDLDFGK